MNVRFMDTKDIDAIGHVPVHRLLARVVFANRISKIRLVWASADRPTSAGAGVPIHL